MPLAFLSSTKGTNLSKQRPEEQMSCLLSVHAAAAESTSTIPALPLLEQVSAASTPQTHLKSHAVGNLNLLRKDWGHRNDSFRVAVTTL